jgi:hypothetical protein
MVKVIPGTLCFESRYTSIALGVIGICFLVLFPCLVEAFEFVQWNERFKKDFGLFVSDKSIPIYDIVGHVVASVDVFSKEKYFHNEGFPEKSSGFVEFSDFYVFFNSINGKAMLNKDTDEITKNPAENCETNIRYIIDELAPRPSFMFVLGAIIMGLFCIFVFHFTQRSHHREAGAVSCRSGAWHG